jgi:hypothetical protein
VGIYSKIDPAFEDSNGTSTSKHFRLSSEKFSCGQFHSEMGHRKCSAQKNKNLQKKVLVRSRNPKVTFILNIEGTTIQACSVVPFLEFIRSDL